MRTRLKVSLALVVALTTIGIAGPAYATNGLMVHVSSASPSDTTVIDTQPDLVGGKRFHLRATAPMNVVGFNSEVAKENGYEIVRTPSGQLASVLREKAAEARSGSYAVPDESLIIMGENTRTGNCGYSFAEIYNIGNGTAAMRTGWGVIKPVTNHFWQVFWDDPVGNNTGWKVWYGPLPQPVTWSSGFFERKMLLQGLPVALEVDAESYVLRVDGIICLSMHPVAFATF